MITLEDCVALCGLTEQEVLAIVEHEHLPEIAAAALASYLVLQEKYGLNRVRDMIVDDIRTAQACGDKEHVLVLLLSSIIFSECILRDGCLIEAISSCTRLAQ